MPYADLGGFSMHYALDNFTDPWRQPETMGHGVNVLKPDRCTQALLRFLARPR